MRLKFVGTAVLAVALIGCGGAVDVESGPTAPTPVVDGEGVASATGEQPAEVAGVSPDAALVLHAEPGVVVDAHSAPNLDAPIVASLRSEIDAPQAFLATQSFEAFEADRSEGEAEWIEVLLPVRPNGQTGWIPMDVVTPYRNGYRIDIDLSDFRMRVSKDGQVITDTVIAVGTDDTPTPLGTFYLIELIQANDPDGVYGPFAFGLSGYSDTLQTFGTGEGVIGIHGTDQPEALGSLVSHGCIRVENSVIEDLAGSLPLGTPVEIQA